MAVAVETNRRDLVIGNIRVVLGTVTAMGNGDTWSPGLRIIEAIDFTPTTNASFGFTVAQGSGGGPTAGTAAVATLASGGSLTGQIQAMGY